MPGAGAGLSGGPGPRHLDPGGGPRAGALHAAAVTASRPGPLPGGLAGRRANQPAAGGLASETIPNVSPFVLFSVPRIGLPAERMTDDALLAGLAAGGPEV